MLRERTRIRERRNTHDTERLTLVLLSLLVMLFTFCSYPLKAVPTRDVGDRLNDLDISLAVMAGLSTDDEVSGHLIDIDVDQGIVTLTGSVDHLLEKDRAVAIARATKGVRSVVDRLRVIPVYRTDEELRTDIRTSLTMNPALENSEIDFEVNDGIVTLTGKVGSWQEKQICLHTVKGVQGIKQIDDHIIIEIAEERSDNEIREDIEHYLDIDVYVESKTIDVEVDDGKVKLSGTVGSDAERERARNDAWVRGVRAVDVSDLNVNWRLRTEMRRSHPPVILSDEKIKHAVRDALFYDNRVESADFEIRCIAGAVTLSGEVDNLSEKRAAEETARNTIGVWRVNNYLRVRPEEQPTDTVLKENIEDAFRRNFFIDEEVIQVRVFNGKVYLNGTVDSFFDKLQAETVASQVPGVIDIENRLHFLSPRVTSDDREIEEDIRSELFWSPFVDNEDIEVTVENGIATLEGTVYSWFERRKAAENAREGGAVMVKNHLKVQNSRGYEELMEEENTTD